MYQYFKTTQLDVKHLIYLSDHLSLIWQITQVKKITQSHIVEKLYSNEAKVIHSTNNPRSLSITLISKNNMVVLHSTELDLYILRLSMVSQRAYSINGMITVGDTYFKNLSYKGVRCSLL